MKGTSLHDADSVEEIQLVVRESGDRRALKELLATEYCVVIEETLQSVDCYLIDELLVSEYTDELLQQKRNAEPAFCPVLAIQRKPADDIGGRLTQLSENEWGIIDDVVSAPVGKQILSRRLGNLLKRRQQSVRLAQRYQRMETRYQQLVGSTNDLLAAVDPNLDYIFANEKYAQYHNLTSDAIEGKSLVSVLGRDDFEEVEKPVKAALQGENTIQEISRENPEKGERIFEAYIFPLLDADGEIDGVGKSLRDISERKRRAEILRQYKQAVESSKDLLSALDEEYNYLFANKEYRDYHGLDAVDITDYTVSQVIGAELLETAKPKIEMALNGNEVQYEHIRTHPEKGERTLEVQYFPLKDEEGEIRGVGASMRDISRQKQLRENLEESKERYESLFNSIRDAILVANTDREIINCNPAFVDLFGYELEEIEGKQTKYVYASEEEYREMGEAIEGYVGDPQFTHQVEYEKKSGQTFPGETNVFYLRNADDDIVGFIGVVRDVSDRQNRLKQLQRVDRVLQHNFHNDINIIQGFAENIETEGDPPVTEFAQKIRKTGTGLLKTVENEREITKFLSDPPPSESLNLRQVCEAVVDRVSSSHPQASVFTECSQDIVIEATPAIELAIEELLINAITHSPETEPQVLLMADLLNGAVAIRVQDTNPRIPEMDRNVITGEEELSSLYHGSGMGLWLISLIVNHSEGKLEFDKNEPDGNIVSILLPKE